MPEKTSSADAVVTALFPRLWPEVKSGQFRPLKTGISADVSAWIAANPQAGLSEAEWKETVRFVVSRLAYLRTVTEGTARVDLTRRDSHRLRGAAFPAQNGRHPRPVYAEIPAILKGRAVSQ